MDSIQKAALESLVDRSLTAQEVADIDQLLPVRNDVAIAAVLSDGRTRLQSHMIGIGTILACMKAEGLAGGEFLDALKALGNTNRDVYWIMTNIERGALDMGESATQESVVELKPAFASWSAGLDRLLALGRVADPIHYNAVSDALNIAEGRLTL